MKLGQLVNILMVLNLEPSVFMANLWEEGKPEKMEMAS